MPSPARPRVQGGGLQRTALAFKELQPKGVPAEAKGASTCACLCVQVGPSDDVFWYRYGAAAVSLFSARPCSTQPHADAGCDLVLQRANGGD